MKKTATLLLALVLIFLTACTQPEDKQITILQPGEVVELHTQVQAQYLEDALDSIDSYATGRVSRDEPEPLHLEWTGPDGEYTVTLQEEGSSGKISRTTQQKQLSLEGLGLKTDTCYTLTVTLAGGETPLQAECTFRTCAHGPRNLAVDKVDNVRDLGGWAANGGRVKQGLAIRGGRLNQNKRKADGTVSVKISQKGIAYMTETLGIRTEIDLRDLSENGYDPYGVAYSVLGEGVTYIACPMKNEAPNYDPSDPVNYESLIKCLEVFADPDAYPIYFHCSVGTDRTGYVAYLINGLLGVPKEELLRDYLFSNFASIGGSRSLSDIGEKYVAQIDACPGDTLPEKIRSYLVDTVGVSPETLDGIVANLAEK